MWIVGQLEFRPRRLDFGSAGLGVFDTTAVDADGVELVNALDFVDISDDAFQAMVCEHCGTPGCQSGNWVTLRRLETGLVIMPAFDRLGGTAKERQEYAPPYFLETKGIPWIRNQALSTLANRVPFLADLARWPELSVREAAQIIQWEAPRGLWAPFPDPPGPLPGTEAVVTHGENRNTVGELTRLLREALQDSRPAALVPEGESVTLYLGEGLATNEWQPLTTDGTSFRLALAPGVGIMALERSGG